MGDDVAPLVIPEGMTAVYTVVEGMSIDVPPFGSATFDRALLVPASIVESLCEEGRLRRGDLLTVTSPPPRPSVLGGVPAFHAEGGKVFHVRADCPTGNDIEPQNRRDGDGGLKPCKDCQKLAREGKE